MKMLVCIKQVPVMEGHLAFEPETKWLAETGVEFRMNRFDEFAIEEALAIKESIAGATVDVLSLGPGRVETALRRALGMGADHGIHIACEKEGLIPPRFIAGQIGAYAKTKGYDLVFTGIMSEDSMQCVVGPLVAARLGISCAVSVVKTDIKNAMDPITVTCELEGGRHQHVQLRLPAFLTVQSGINRPRYPSLSNMLRANRQALETIACSPDEKPADGICALSFPEKPKNTVLLNGSSEDQAGRLIKILQKKSLLKG